MSFHWDWAKTFLETIAKYIAAMRLKRYAKIKELSDFPCIR
jgi:hypothetical protein